MYQNEDEWCHYVWLKCQFLMPNLAWDREINISLSFGDVFVWKWGPRPRTSSRCSHGNESAATFKKGIFVHPPWVPNCMQNLKGGWKFSFPKMFDSYRLDLKRFNSWTNRRQPLTTTVWKISWHSAIWNGALENIVVARHYRVTSLLIRWMSLKTNLSLADENDEQAVGPQRFDELRLCDEFISSGGDFCTT